MPNEKNEQTRAQLLNKVRSNALNRLREEHPDEFAKYQSEEATTLGVEWKPRLTPEQKAQQDFAKLLAENPALAESFATAAAEKVAERIEKSGPTQ